MYHKVYIPNPCIVFYEKFFLTRVIWRILLALGMHTRILSSGRSTDCVCNTNALFSSPMQLSLPSL